jgi:hypothetical protein
LALHPASDLTYQATQTDQDAAVGMYGIFKTVEQPKRCFISKEKMIFTSFVIQAFSPRPHHLQLVANVKPGRKRTSGTVAMQKEAHGTYTCFTVEKIRSIIPIVYIVYPEGYRLRKFEIDRREIACKRYSFQIGMYIFYFRNSNIVYKPFEDSLHYVSHPF